MIVDVAVFVGTFNNYPTPIPPFYICSLFHNSQRGECGHFPRLGVLLLRFVPEPHPEQQRRNHLILQDLATQRSDPPHGQVGRLCQPGVERWRRVPGYQPGLWSLWSHCRTSKWKVQRQLVAWCQSNPQPPAGELIILEITKVLNDIVCDLKL